MAALKESAEKRQRISVFQHRCEEMKWRKPAKRKASASKPKHQWRKRGGHERRGEYGQPGVSAAIRRRVAWRIGYHGVKAAAGVITPMAAAAA
jgi:hypothetical protein